MVIIIYRGYRVLAKHSGSCSHILNTMVHMAYLTLTTCTVLPFTCKSTDGNQVIRLYLKLTKYGNVLRNLLFKRTFRRE